MAEEAWAGFSQEELQRLRSQRPDLYEPSEQQRRPHTASKSRKPTQRERAFQQQCQKLQGGAASVPPEQLLSAPKHKPGPPQQPVPSPHPPPAGDQKQSEKGEQQKEGTPAACNGSGSTQTHPAKTNSSVEKKKVALLAGKVTVGNPPARAAADRREEQTQEGTAGQSYC